VILDPKEKVECKVPEVCQVQQAAQEREGLEVSWGKLVHLAQQENQELLVAEECQDLMVQWARKENRGTEA